MKKPKEFNGKVYILRPVFKIEEGRFISKGPVWDHVLFKNGEVIGIRSGFVFSDRADALEALVKKLKEKIIEDKEPKK